MRRRGETNDSVAPLRLPSVSAASARLGPRENLLFRRRLLFCAHTPKNCAALQIWHLGLQASRKRVLFFILFFLISPLLRFPYQLICMINSWLTPASWHCYFLRLEFRPTLGWHFFFVLADCSSRCSVFNLRLNGLHCSSVTLLFSNLIFFFCFGSRAKILLLPKKYPKEASSFLLIIWSLMSN